MILYVYEYMYRLELKRKTCYKKNGKNIHIAITVFQSECVNIIKAKRVVML